MEKGLPVDEGRLQLVTGLHKRKTAVDLVKGTVRCGVPRLVDEAIAGVRMAVCSTSQEASVRTLVQTLWATNGTPSSTSSAATSSCSCSTPTCITSP